MPIASEDGLWHSAVLEAEWGIGPPLYDGVDRYAPMRLLDPVTNEWYPLPKEQRLVIDEQATQLDEQATQLDEQATQLNEQATQLNEQAVQIDEQATQLDKQKTYIAILRIRRRILLIWSDAWGLGERAHRTVRMRNARRNRPQLALDTAAGRTRSRGRRLPEDADGADTGRIAVGQRGIDGEPGVPSACPAMRQAPRSVYSWLGRCTICSRGKSERGYGNRIQQPASILGCLRGCVRQGQARDWIGRICARGYPWLRIRVQEAGTVAILAWQHARAFGHASPSPVPMAGLR